MSALKESLLAWIAAARKRGSVWVQLEDGSWAQVYGKQAADHIDAVQTAVNSMS